MRKRSKDVAADVDELPLEQDGVVEAGSPTRDATRLRREIEHRLERRRLREELGCWDLDWD